MPETVEVKDQFGKPVTVPVGLDGVNPVTPDNPSPKSVPEDRREAAVEAARASVVVAVEPRYVAGVDDIPPDTEPEDDETPEPEPVPEKPEGTRLFQPGADEDGFGGDAPAPAASVESPDPYQFAVQPGTEANFFKIESE